MQIKVSECRCEGHTQGSTYISFLGILSQISTDAETKLLYFDRHMLVPQTGPTPKHLFMQSYTIKSISQISTNVFHVSTVRINTIPNFVVNVFYNSKARKKVVCTSIQDLTGCYGKDREEER